MIEHLIPASGTLERALMVYGITAFIAFLPYAIGGIMILIRENYPARRAEINEKGG